MRFSLACRCGAEAKKQGFAGFAMHYYGECYGRTSAEIEEVVSKEHIKDRCIGDQTYTDCVHGSHEHCTGGASAEAVYRFKSSAEESMSLIFRI